MYTLGHRWRNELARLLAAFAPLGSISYGIYIIHYPILVLFQRIPFLTGSPRTFMVRLVVYLAVCLASAWWLEKQLQPWIKNKLLKTPPRLLPGVQK